MSQSISSGALGPVYRNDTDDGLDIIGFGAYVNELNANVTVAITGQSISVSKGTVTPNTAASISGQSTTASQGSVVASPSVVLAGQQIVLSQGALTIASVVSLQGQSIPVSQGSTVAAIGMSIQGQSIAASKGSVSTSSSVSLTGQEIDAAQGIIAIPADVTVSITGLSIGVSQGDVSVLVGSDSQSGVSRLYAIYYYTKRIAEKEAKRVAEEKEESDRRARIKSEGKLKAKKTVISRDVEDAYRRDELPVQRNVSAPIPQNEIDIAQLIAHILYQLPLMLPYWSNPESVQVPQFDMQQELERQRVVAIVARRQRDIETILLLAA